MNEKTVLERLVEMGWRQMRSPKQPVAYAMLPEADAMINQLDRYPHAFVLACLMDQQIKAEKAWVIPFRIHERLGGFEMSMLGSLSPADVARVMREPTPLHRFIDKMSECLYLGIQRIIRQYGGDASRIWCGNPPSGVVVNRFLEFKGIGPKIATMAVNILAREFKVPFSDYGCIDISADVHIRRVFFRLGFCEQEPSVEQAIHRARELYPEFPGLIDFPCWEIGKNWCRARDPLCEQCYMKDLCRTANAGRARILRAVERDD